MRALRAYSSLYLSMPFVCTFLSYYWSSEVEQTVFHMFKIASFPPEDVNRLCGFPPAQADPARRSKGSRVISVKSFPTLEGNKIGLGEITRTHAHSPRILRAFSARAENVRRMRREYAENTRRMRGEYASVLRVLSAYFPRILRAL